MVPAGAVTEVVLLRPNEPTTRVCGSEVVTDGAVAVRVSRVNAPLFATSGEAPSMPRYAATAADVLAVLLSVQLAEAGSDDDATR